MEAVREPRIIVIGAGVAGITTAYVLQKAGFTDFTVLEKGSDVGGVWHWNHYPGLTCDVPSQIYQFGFAPKPDWSKIWSSGPEIQRYHRDVAERFGLMDRIRLNTEVAGAVFDDAAGTWTVTLAGDDERPGEELTADFVVCATGVLQNPSIPDIPGLDTFAGPVVHTARWDDDLATDGKRIAVIGTGSTGVQVVSALQPRAATITHFTRTPQWILWAPMSLPQVPLAGTVLKAFPAAHDALYRGLLWGSGILADIVRNDTWRRHAVQKYARLSLRAQISDDALREDLTPDYQPLCKRQVVSGTYYRAIRADNAELITDAIVEVTPDGIVTADGTRHDVDVIVLATGFRAHDYMRPMTVVGRDGLTIDEAWAEGPRAYRMTAIPGFPNLFTVLGPNSPTGSISLQHTAEKTARYLVSWFDAFRRGDADRIEVTEEATAEFNAQVREALEPTIWNTGGCNSWYFTESGVVDLWPFDRATLDAMLAEPEPAHYRVTRTEQLRSVRPGVGAE
ncbi:flavin-containing monooxygenase [Gordonia phthalatica]|uniref:Monooxygenase n=1 Tax=Gordonia phthalatica TaxID=1136941 RepID=A0A0N9NGI0_9ACTN|nr:NAD(P)/FAD-dependent oxidoreductase [Gordonia phthalatica]ALG86867.1 monooxygenase [Gordonia phthalatica]